MKGIYHFSILKTRLQQTNLIQYLDWKYRQLIVIDFVTRLLKYLANSGEIKGEKKRQLYSWISEFLYSVQSGKDIHTDKSKK